MEINILNLTISQAHKDLTEGKYTAKDLLFACKKNIDERNEEINAFLEVFDDAEKMADRAQEIIDAGDATPLTGIPIALKDNILFKDHISSSASKILENHKAVYDSTAVSELKKQGAVLIGRCNMDEMAMGASGETSAFGVTRNPVDTTKVPGGSSAGSAAAVAMGGCLAALGSDTAGSVRQPAGFCGAVGFKPGYGMVSRHGLMAMGNSLDVIGVIGKNVTDVRIVNDAISVSDEMDSMCVKDTERATQQKEIKKIGVPRSFVEADGIDPEVKERFEEGLEKLKKQGYEIIDVDIPFIEYSLHAYYILMPAEASTNLSRYDGIRYGLSLPGSGVDDSYMKTREAGFGKEVQRRILLGTYVLSHGYYDAYYNKAVKVRAKIIESLNKVFEEVDVIATPTSPKPAFEFNSKKDPVEMYLADVFTVPANIAYLPAISLPNGVNSEGLPLDIQFMGQRYQDNSLLEFVRDFEK